MEANKKLFTQLPIATLMALTFSAMPQQKALAQSLTIISEVPDNPTCNGGKGSAAITVTGGVAPYTYSWSPEGGTNASATGLTAGNYTVTVEDYARSIITEVVTITQPSILTPTIENITYPLCNGENGSVSVFSSGGTPPYAYKWSSSDGSNVNITSLAAGVYTVILEDANGCNAMMAIPIIQPTPVLISITSVTTIVCERKSTIYANTAVGGTAPYTYLWSGGGGTNLTATGLSAGTYTITATDNHGCVGDAKVIITMPTQLDVPSISISNVSCYGESNGSATCLVSGGSSPYTYSWFPCSGSNTTVENLSAGTYTVTVTDNSGCNEITPVIITQPASMDIATYLSPASFGVCNGKAAVTVLSGGTAPFTYSWSPGGETTDTIKNQCAGTYSCIITQANHCSQSALVYIEASTGIANIADQSLSISSYPNPSNGQLLVSGLEKGMLVEVYDYTGNKVSTIEAEGATLQVNITKQPDGIYLILARTKNGVLIGTCKAIKTR